MSTLIVAFPKLEEAKAVRNLLIHRGFDVAVPCTSGAQAINQADTLSDGIIICGYKLSDNMVYTELYEYKPKSFEMLLVASQNRWEDCQDNGIVCAAMPIKVNDLVSTIEMMLQAQIRRRKKLRSQPRKRSPKEQKIIDDATASGDKGIEVYVNDKLIGNIDSKGTTKLKIGYVSEDELLTVKFHADNAEYTLYSISLDKGQAET